MKKKVHSTSTHPTPNELGQMMTNIYESGYLNRTEAYKMSFVKGLLGGFGGVIGATIGIAILLWMLSLLHHVPFVHRIADNARQTIQTDKK